MKTKPASSATGTSLTRTVTNTRIGKSFLKKAAAFAAFAGAAAVFSAGETKAENILTWNGTDVAFHWNTTDDNWLDSVSGPAVATHFQNGDSVVFDNSVPFVLAGTVQIDFAGVTVNNMTVSGSGYIFNSGKITGTGALVVNESVHIDNQIEFAGGITVATGKDIYINTDISGSWTLASNITGDGGLVLAGVGSTKTFTLTGENSFTGGTRIDAESGALQIGDGGTTGSITGNIVNNSRVTFNRSDDITYTGALTGSGRFYKEGTGTLTLTQSATQGDFFLHDGTLALADGVNLTGNFNDDLGNTLQVSKSTITPTGGVMYLTGTTIKIVDYSATTGTALTIGGGVSISSNITLDVTTAGGSGLATGSYTLVSAGNTDFSGTFTGTVNGVAPGLTGDVPSIRYGGSEFDTSTVGKIILNVISPYDQSRTATWTGATNSTWNETDDNWTLSGSDYKVFKNGDDVVFSGIGVGTVNIDNGNYGDITIGNMTISHGAGEYIFTGQDIAVAGTLTKIDAGTVTFNQANNFTSVTLTGGTVNVNVNGALGTGEITIGSDYGFTLNLADGIELANDVIIAGINSIAVAAGDSAEISGNITGNAFSFTKTGTGTLTLSGDNSYTGNTRLLEGRINITGDTALGTGRLTLNDGTTLGFAADGITIANSVSLDNGIATFDTGGNNAEISGKIVDYGALEKTGTGALTLSGDNTYTGSTTVTGGTLIITGKLGNGNYGGDIALANAVTFALDQTADQTLTGEISGLGYVYKTGAGTLTLTGDSTAFSGIFLQQDGTLHLAENAKLGGLFLLQNATLTTGDGVRLNGAIFSDGSTITPAGTLTIAGNATFAGTTINFGEITTETGYNNIAVGGDIDITGGITINVDFSGNNVDGNNSYQLITGGDRALTGDISNVTGNATLREGQRGGFYDNSYGIGFSLINGNTTLGWVAAADNSVWSNSAGDVNWGAGYFETYFKNGDIVIFGSMKPAPGPTAGQTVVVDSAGVTAEMMLLTESHNFTGGAITVTGALMVLDYGNGTTLGLEISDTPAITAGIVIFGEGASLNITGYTPDESSPHDAPKNTQTLIVATGMDGYDGALITGLDAGNITVAGQTTVDFLTARAFIENDSLKVETTLSWNRGDDNAHGTFTLDAGSTFTLGAMLADQTVTGGTWDGATLTKEGDGKLTLTGANTYTGGTVITAGTLVSKNENAIGDGDVNIATGGTLELDYTGAFGKTVTGDGALNIAGDITINGAIGAATTAVTGGTLRGTGDFSALVVRNGGTLAPGNSIGITTANNGAIFETGSTYAVEIDATKSYTGNALTDDSSDRLVVTGSADIDTANTTLAVTALGEMAVGDNRSYLILTADGGITNTFASIDALALYDIAQQLVGGTELYLDVTRKLAQFGDLLTSSGVGSANDTRLAYAFDTIDAAGQSGAISTITDALAVTTTAEEAAAIFAQLHGEAYAASLQAAILLQNRFVTKLPSTGERISFFQAKQSVWLQAEENQQRKIAQKTGDADAAPDAAELGINLWAQTIGDYLKVDKNDGYSGYNLKSGGLMVGADKIWQNQFFTGIALGYEHGKQDFKNITAENEFDAFRTALYGGVRHGALHLDAHLGYARVWNETERHLTYTGATTKAESDSTDDIFFAGVKLGCDFAHDALLVTPSIGLDYTYLHRDDFTEKKGGDANLRIDADSYQSLRMPLGVQLRYQYVATNGIVWQPELSAYYVLEMADKRGAVDANFASVSGIGFQSKSSSLGRHSGVIGAGLSVQLTESTTLRFRYQGEFHNNAQYHSGLASVTVSF